MIDAGGLPQLADPAVLELKDLVKEYAPHGYHRRSERAPIRAVGGISLTVRRGETLGIVGESGCGKSTLAKLALGLIKPTSGEVLLEQTPISEFSRQERSSAIQLVMQDPYSSLNPRMTVLEIVSEAYIAHPELVGGRAVTDLATEVLALVGLGDHFLYRYPHQLSGGQRQRVGIARALALKPSMIVCDEPVSALDMSVQAQIINLLRSLQRKFALAYMFISHDLDVVQLMSDRIAVIYLGKIVEEGPTEAVYEHPAHPYTQALIATRVATRNGRKQSGTPLLQGELPDPSNPPSGCPFRTRCWKATDLCAVEVPPAREVGTDGQIVRCHFPFDAVGSTVRVVDRSSATVPEDHRPIDRSTLSLDRDI